MNQKGFGLASLIIAIAVITILAGGGFYISNLGEGKSSLETGLDAIQEAKRVKDLIENRDNESLQDQVAIDTSNWKTYRNEEYRFEISYPQTWFILETANDINISKSELQEGQLISGNPFVQIKFPAVSPISGLKEYCKLSKWNNVPAYECDQEVFGGFVSSILVALIPLGDGVLTITNQFNNNVSEHILKTFKFIE